VNIDVIDHAGPTFFAPTSSGAIDLLLAQYQAMRVKIDRIADVMGSPDLEGALHYFGEYAKSNDQRLASSNVEQMFDREGAIAYLNAAYWSKALQLTDVLDLMPQKRRDEWNQQIRNPMGEKKDRFSKVYITPPIPEFADDAVRSTLKGLMAQREAFFAERVDGIFRSLSKTHLTNAPEGFSRRMILANVVNEWGNVEHGRAGVINDLRCIIARFMGREEPKWDATAPVIRYARGSLRGEWVDIDGGALRIRCYAVGTAHLEVHPDIAWRLNCVLAQLYPTAIPTEFRERPKRKLKDFKLMRRPLPFDVLARLATLSEARDLNPTRGYRDNTWVKVPGCYDLKAGSAGASHHVNDEVARVLQTLGGTPIGKAGLRWAFDYCPLEVVKGIEASGCIPDQKAHQFYPTPAWLAEQLVASAAIGFADTVLEPSAGMGGLADLLPKDRTVCVEVSDLHCKVLQAKGHAVACADFLAWDQGRQFDRIVMNPPFSEGRWQAHLQHAAAMLRRGGRLVAILPSSAKTKSADLLPGMAVQCLGQFDDAFPGASVSVVIVAAEWQA
jgi:hypothetical protein